MIELHKLTIEVSDGTTITLEPRRQGALLSSLFFLGLWAALATPLWFVAPLALIVLGPLAVGSAIAWYFNVKARRDFVKIEGRTIRIERQQRRIFRIRLFSREVSVEEVERVVSARDPLGISFCGLDCGRGQRLVPLISLHVTRQQLEALADAVASQIGVAWKETSMAALREWPD